MVVTPVSDLSGGSTGMSLCISMESILQALSPRCSFMENVKDLVTFSSPSFTTDQRLFASGWKKSVRQCLHPLHHTPPPLCSVVMVTSGSTWGSGVLLLSDVVLTCAHVITNQGMSQTMHGYCHWGGAPLVIPFTCNNNVCDSY